MTRDSIQWNYWKGVILMLNDFKFMKNGHIRVIESHVLASNDIVNS